jgi:hypothetical protein
VFREHCNKKLHRAIPLKVQFACFIIWMRLNHPQEERSMSNFNFLWVLFLALLVNAAPVSAATQAQQITCELLYRAPHQGELEILENSVKMAPMGKSFLLNGSANGFSFAASEDAPQSGSSDDQPWLQVMLTENSTGHLAQNAMDNESLRTASSDPDGLQLVVLPVSGVEDAWMILSCWIK